MIENMLFEGDPLTPSRVAEVEARLGVSLPADYVRFLLSHNGGRPEPDDFPVSTTAGSLVGNLYKITDASTREKRISDLVHQNLKKREKLPSGFLEIGYDMGGNGLLLGVSGENAGQLYFLDHEELEGQPLKERFWKIADSFAQFVESLGWRTRAAPRK
jgi:hypothetical protein